MTVMNVSSTDTTIAPMNYTLKSSREMYSVITKVARKYHDAAVKASCAMNRAKTYGMNNAAESYGYAAKLYREVLDVLRPLQFNIEYGEGSEFRNYCAIKDAYNEWIARYESLLDADLDCDQAMSDETDIAETIMNVLCDISVAVREW